jgi:hypothetical protein
VNKNEYRPLRLLRPENIQFLDLGRTIGFALRLADSFSHRLAVGSESCHDLRETRFINGLIVRCVEFNLVIVKKNERAFCVRWRTQLLLTQSTPGLQGDRCASDSKNVAARCHGLRFGHLQAPVVL